MKFKIHQWEWFIILTITIFSFIHLLKSTNYNWDLLTPFYLGTIILNLITYYLIIILLHGILIPLIDWIKNKIYKNKSKKS